MLVVKNIRVWTLDRDSLTVTWEIEDTPQIVSDYTLTILRSNSQAGPYTEIGSPFVADSTDEYVDSAVNILSKWREFYYRIKVTRTLNDETWTWGSVDSNLVVQGEDPGGVMLESPPDILAIEAIRRFNLQQREFSGRKVLALTQKTWGTRCTVCWDKLKRRRVQSKCTTCYDTGFTGGYFDPKEAWVGRAPPAVVNLLNPVMELQPNDVVMLVSATPRLKPADLLIDADGRRWRVTKIQRSEKLWSLTHQQVVVRELSRDQVDYDVPVTWDINPFSANPPRQHIAAVDIDSYFKRAQDLGIEDT